MIIGLYGKARSGKDTVGDIIAKELRATRLAFAEPIKRMAAELLDLNTVEELEQMKEIEFEHLHGATGRKILQTLGTEWGRQTIHPRIWINYLEERMEIHRLAAKQENFVITDVRFRNEARWIIDKKGILIEVLRPDCPKINGMNHTSETIEIPMAHAYIMNDGSLEDLEVKVKKVLTAIPYLVRPE